MEYSKEDLGQFTRNTRLCGAKCSVLYALPALP